MGVETLLYFFVICFNTRSENRHYIRTKNSKYAVHLASVFFDPGTFHLKLHGCGRRAGHDPSRASGILPHSIFGTLDRRCGAVQRSRSPCHRGGGVQGEKTSRPSFDEPRGYRSKTRSARVPSVGLACAPRRHLAGTSSWGGAANAGRSAMPGAARHDAEQR